MNNELNNLYQEIILEAARNPVGKTTFSNINTVNTADTSDIVNPTDTANTANIIDTADTTDISHTPTSDISHTLTTKTYTGTSHQFNPSCGDEVELRIRFKDNTIDDISWEGEGCSISMASLSLMTERLQGLKIKDAQHLAQLFDELMHSKGEGLANPKQEEELEDLMAFEGTSAFPMRIKCALLGWEGFKDILTHYAVSHDVQE